MITTTKTDIAKIRLIIEYTDEMNDWLNNFFESDYSKDGGYSFLLKIEKSLKETFDQIVRGMINEYFIKIGVAKDRLPSLQHTNIYLGSLILEAAIVITGTVWTTFTFIKSLSELPEIADGLAELKNRIAEKLNPTINRKVNREIYEIAKKMYLSKEKKITKPPSYLLRINFEIDVDPLRQIAASSETFEEFLRKSGYKDSGKHAGNPASLQSCLAWVYREYMKGAKSKENDCRNKIEELHGKNRMLEQKIQDAEQLINIKNEKKKEIKAELREIATNPKKFDIESDFNFFGFIMGACLLIFLTVYLWIFYSSAVYSAFFKNPGDIIPTINTNDISLLFNTIFDPDAITKAKNSGKLGLIFTLLAPIIFIATGFILSVISGKKNQSLTKRNVRMASVILFIFIADLLIAIKITQQIYELKYLMGVINKEWESHMLLKDINFYLVLIAGFAAYIIWGILLDYVKEELNNSKSLKNAKRKREEIIDELDQEISRIIMNLNGYKKDINLNEIEIKKLQNQLEDRFINWGLLSTALDIYVSGWLEYVKGISRIDKDPEVQEKIEGARLELDMFKTSIQAKIEN